MAGGIEVVDPPEEIPSGQQFLHQLPERARWVEETAFIVDIFSHVGQGTSTFIRSLCERRSISEDNRQVHPHVCY